MIRVYYLKWYFIVTGVLTSATTLSLLLRADSLYDARWWEYPEYAFQISFTLFVSWLIHGFFLLNNFKGLHSQSKHILSIICAALFTFLTAFILYNILPVSKLNTNNVPFDTVQNVLIHLIGGFLASIVTYVVFYSVHANVELQNTRLENEILEQAHLRAQLISLQQQISPHFLFNSLSTLKTLTNEKPTKDYIIQLATVYRYVLNFNQHHLTPLREELTFVHSYLYILKTRFEESLQVTVDIPEEYMDLLMPPLCLQLLIENAIKHNMISPERPLMITINANDTPALLVSNQLQLKNRPEEGTGTGLNNIRERYRILAKKLIEVSDEDGCFAVTLPLIKT